MNPARLDDCSAFNREALHQPVMAHQLAALVVGEQRLRIVDATVGAGGHAAVLLEGVPATACLLGLDRDPEAVQVAAERLRGFGSRAIVRVGNFADLKTALASAGFTAADIIIADLGMSSFALDNPERGLSFRAAGPLDMRVDRESQSLTAADLLNRATEAELARIFREYGEEPAARRIAKAIVAARRRQPFATTAELRLLVERVLGRRRASRIHPATRIFQALRIAVNDELNNLARFLEQAPLCLAPGGRLAVIAYHSLEDRPVKERFRELSRKDDFHLITPKALRPDRDEIARNPRARSARLRVIERSR